MDTGNESAELSLSPQLSLSIKETNKLRAKLGLKPLEVKSQIPGIENEDQETSKPVEVFVKTENLREKKKAEDFREKLRVIKEKRAIEEKLRKTKGIADSDSEDESPAAWVIKHQRIMQEKLEAEKKAKLLEEMDEEFGVGALVEEEFDKKKVQFKKPKEKKKLKKVSILKADNLLAGDTVEDRYIGSRKRGVRDMDDSEEKEWNSKAKKPKMRENEPILEEEPDISMGVVGALKLATMKGYLDKEDKKMPSAPRTSTLQAQSYTVEEKFYEDDKFDKRPVQEFREKSNYKPDVKLEYIDDNGRLLTAKEAFRYLSHKFHGKGPGKNKVDKRMKKLEQDTRLKQMSSTDTPLNTVKLLKIKLKETNSPFIVLSAGNLK